MGVKHLWFPIALAIVWVVMAAMAMADFASFSATTRPLRPAVARRTAASTQPPSASTQTPSLPQGRTGARLALN